MYEEVRALNRRQAMAGAAMAGVAAMTASEAALASPRAAPPVQTSGPRTFPPPSTISKAAQDYLRKGAMQQPPLPIPAIGDVAGWRSYIAQGNSPLPVDMILKIPGFETETRKFGNATCYVITPHTISAPERHKAHLSIHGGGWVLFGGDHAKALGIIAAMQHGGVTYAVDYRMPPDHPYPAGLDDCLEVYRALVGEHGAGNVLVSGESAGGNLAAALMLKVRDAGLEKPAALVLRTPATDLTSAGDSWKVLYGLDPVLRDETGVGSVELYLNGNNPRQPYLSPLFGDLATAFPPTHLVSGTRDRLLSDTVRMHAALRAAGVEADLYIGEAMPHSGFGQLTAEDQAVLKDTLRWLARRWPRAEQSAGSPRP